GGTYNIYLGAGGKTSNYTITFEADNDAFSITQRSIELIASTATKVYGESDPSLEVTLVTGSTLSTSDDLSDITGALSRESGDTAGTYDIYLGTGSKTSNHNITFETDNDAFSITRRSIELTATSVSKTYGDIDPALAVSVTSGDLVDGDNLSEITGTLTRETGDTVGTYDIYLGTGSKTSNYNITFEADNDAFSMTHRLIELISSTDSKAYGESDPALAVRITT